MSAEVTAAEEGRDLIAIVELGSPPLESPSPSSPAPLFRAEQRTFSCPFPTVLRLQQEEEKKAAAVELQDTAALLEEFKRCSAHIVERGPPVYPLRLPPLWNTSPLLLLSFAAAALTVVSGVLYNLTCDDDNRALRVVGIALTNVGLNVGVSMMLLMSVAPLYPAMLRSRALRAVVLLCYCPYIVLHALQWSLAPSKAAFFAGEKTLAQNIIAVFSEGPAFWLALLVPFELGRKHWKRLKRDAFDAKAPLRAKLFSQSGVMHQFTYWMHTLLFLGVVLGAFCGVSTFVSRTLGGVLAVVMVPYLLWTLSRPNREIPTWSGGYGLFYGNAQFTTLVLANLLPLIMEMFAGSVAGSMLAFLAYYCVFGVFFSGFQLVIGRATEPNFAPQFLFIFQLFLDAFIGLTFVELRSVGLFWILLVLQSLWNIFRCTGAFAWAFMAAKSAFMRCRGSDVSAVATQSFLLNRDQYFFFLNMQGVYSDVLCGILVPLLFVIDWSLPMGNRGVSAVFSAETITIFFTRYAFLFSFRLITGIIAFASYAIRYASMTASRQKGVTLAGVFAAAKSLWLALNLFVWRNIGTLSGVILYLFSYLLFPVIANHGFGEESRSSSS